MYLEYLKQWYSAYTSFWEREKKEGDGYRPGLKICMCIGLSRKLVCERSQRTERPFVQPICPFVYWEPRQGNQWRQNPNLADWRYLSLAKSFHWGWKGRNKWDFVCSFVRTLQLQTTFSHHLFFLSKQPTMQLSSNVTSICLLQTAPQKCTCRMSLAFPCQQTRGRCERCKN